MYIVTCTLGMSLNKFLITKRYNFGALNQKLLVDQLVVFQSALGCYKK